VARTDENAILEGDFTLMLEGKLKLSYLTEDSQLISGDQITTSGLGLVYPAGLVVGTIESIHTEANGLDRYAVVRPAADLDGQRYVFIIKDFEVVE
jgi:rod shape-determining protein MreC